MRKKPLVIVHSVKSRIENAVGRIDIYVQRRCWLLKETGEMQRQPQILRLPPAAGRYPVFALRMRGPKRATLRMTL